MRKSSLLALVVALTLASFGYPARTVGTEKWHGEIATASLFVGKYVTAYKRHLAGKLTRADFDRRAADASDHLRRLRAYAVRTESAPADDGKYEKRRLLLIAGIDQALPLMQLGQYLEPLIKHLFTPAKKNTAER